MGEYIDIGIQNSIFPVTILISSLIVGAYALFGIETENDDDDSDSGSGGLMQPIWNYLSETCFVFLFKIFAILFKDPKSIINTVIDEIIMKKTKKIW